nr:NADH dehydrogenase subunit 4L [Tropiduchidae sp. 1 WQW-2023a]
MLFGLIIFFFCLVGILFVRSHFLLMLLLLEFLLVSLFLIIYVYLLSFSYDYYFLIIFLVMGVCDGVLGLSLIVFLMRKSNSDYVDSVSIYF